MFNVKQFHRNLYIFIYEYIDGSIVGKQYPGICSSLAPREHQFAVDCQFAVYWTTITLVYCAINYSPSTHPKHAHTTESICSLKNALALDAHILHDDEPRGAIHIAKSVCVQPSRKICRFDGLTRVELYLYEHVGSQSYALLMAALEIWCNFDAVFGSDNSLFTQIITNKNKGFSNWIALNRYTHI